MRSLWFVFLLAVPVFGQQQVVPEEFDKNQARLFKKLTESVSTPCCNNGIPVAYHDSGMAGYVRGIIQKGITEGKDEATLLAQLEGLRLGANQDLPLIFTVPEDDGLGLITWVSPFLMVVLGAFGIVLFLRRSKNKTDETTDEQLLEDYQSHINAELEKQ